MNHSVQQYLSQTLNANVSIGQLRYFPFKTVSIYDVVVTDTNHLALIKAATLKIDVGIPTLWRNGIVLTGIEADSVVVNADNCIAAQIGQSASADTLTSDTPLMLTLDNLRVRHGHVTYKQYAIDDISIDIDNIVLTDTTAVATVRNISLTDLYNNNTPLLLEGSFAMSNDTLRIPSLDIVYGLCDGYISNLTMVRAPNTMLEATLSNSTISFATLQRYLHFLPQSNDAIDINGQISVHNDIAKLHNLTIDNQRSTHIELDGVIDGYSNMHNAYVNVNIKRANTTIDDIASLSGVDVEPTVGQAFGLMSGSADLVGKTNETLKFKAALYTDAGLIDAQANITELNRYTAQISSDGLNISHLTDDQIGRTAFTFNLDGDTLCTHVRGQLPELTVREYTYHDVIVDAIASNNYKTGLITIDDPNGQITIVGEYGSRTNENRLTLTARIANLMTGRTHLTPHIDGKLNFNMRADFAGKDIDNASGEILINGFSFADSIRTATTKNLLLQVKAINNNTKNIVINSDHLNGQINGQFKYTDVPNELYRQLYTHANTLFDAHPARKIGTVDLKMELKYSDIDQYLQFISEDLKMHNTGSINAEINSDEGNSNFQIQIGDIESGEWHIKGFKGTIKSNTENIAIQLDAANVAMPTLGDVGRIAVHNIMSYNIMDTDIEWDNKTLNNSSGTLSSITEFSKDGRYTRAHISFDQSNITLNGAEWTMRKSLFEIGHKYFDVRNFCFEKDDRFITANGKASESVNDTLAIALNRITIEDILQPDPFERYSLGGDVNANLQLIQTYKEPIVNCIANIDRFHVDNDNLEHLNLQTQWSTEKRTLGVDVSIVTGGKTRAHGLGNIDSDNNHMQLDFDIDSLSLGFLNFYLNKAVTNVHGTTSGKLQLHGPLNNIGLDARLVAHRTDFRVISTNADYYFDNNDSVILSPNNMEFRHMRVRDKLGNIGYFSGNIKHNMFSGLKVNIGFDVNNMLVMDMQPTDNPTYYGTIFANGRLDVSGATSNIDIRIKANTCPQTTFSVLPTAKSDQSSSSYIRFKQAETQKEQTQNTHTTDIDLNEVNSWVKADIDVHINPSAQLNVILDPRTDNRLSATGDGNLRLVVDRSGDLQILGTYVIDDGTYNFSFENIINKRFVINKGGTLIWDGDPFNPKINIMATYKVKASLYDLVKNSAEGQDLKKRVPINCNMFLTERMEDPNIRFKIEIPSTMNFNQYTLDQYISTEEEMNRQVFSLLLANRFYASEETTGTQSNTSGGNYIGTTVSELVSNQLSNWISQNRYNIGVGVNYRPGDEVTQDEYEVALSTQMLDNKIILSGNIGYGRSTTETSDGSLIGDFDVEVKLNKSGNLRAKAYTHSNNDVIYETSPTTQGVGISFREEFNSFRELLRKYWNTITGKRSKKENTENKKEEQ